VRQKARRTLQVAKSWRIREKREQNSRCNVHNRLTKGFALDIPGGTRAPSLVGIACAGAPAPPKREQNSRNLMHNWLVMLIADHRDTVSGYVDVCGPQPTPTSLIPFLNARD
jgi:hypothetical protein